MRIRLGVTRWSGPAKSTGRSTEHAAELLLWWSHGDNVREFTISAKAEDGRSVRLTLNESDARKVMRSIETEIGKPLTIKRGDE